MKNSETWTAPSIDLSEGLWDGETGNTWQIRPLTMRENAQRMLLTSCAYFSGSAGDS
jgi:hypothetical protein